MGMTRSAFNVAYTSTPGGIWNSSQTDSPFDFAAFSSFSSHWNCVVAGS